MSEEKCVDSFYVKINDENAAFYSDGLKKEADFYDSLIKNYNTAPCPDFSKNLVACTCVVGKQVCNICAPSHLLFPTKQHNVPNIDVWDKDYAVNKDFGENAMEEKLEEFTTPDGTTFLMDVNKHDQPIKGILCIYSWHSIDIEEKYKDILAKVRASEVEVMILHHTKSQDIVEYIKF